MNWPDLISWPLLMAGSFFLVVGAIGLIRMPDVFTRAHAVSVSETLGVGLILGGLMIQGGFTLVTFKLVCLFLLIFFTAPGATHALLRAAMAAGQEPLLASPKLDATSGEIKVGKLRKTKKVTESIDASPAEAAAATFIEESEVDGEHSSVEKPKIKQRHKQPKRRKPIKSNKKGKGK